VFDGKPPAEKNAVLKRRYCEKQEAHTEYLLLEQKMNEVFDPTELFELQQKMVSLKKKMVRLTYYHIDQAIELIDAFGFQYYLAPHEADQLCVYLTVTGKAYACMSDDMDIIVASCPFVIRNLNLMTHEAILYNTKNILCDLNLDIKEFREVVVLSGTDYETDTVVKQNTITLRKAFDYFYQYRKCLLDEPDAVSQSESMPPTADVTSIQKPMTTNFHEWLNEKKIIQNNDFEKICSMFDINKYLCEMSDFVRKNTVKRQKMSVPTIKKIMQKYKFIFA
jgi:5'-3' exonuclease